MTFRRTAGVLAFSMAFCLLQPLGAHAQATVQWDPNRSDSRAPLGVTEDVTLMKGQVELGVRYFNQKMKDLGIGTGIVPLATVLNGYSYSAAPVEMVSQSAVVYLSLGVTDALTLTARGAFSHKLASDGVVDPAQAGQYWRGETTSYGPEDVEVHALFKILDQSGVRIHLHTGVSIPLGLTDFDDLALDPEDPFGTQVEVNLPYLQQLGSGSFELLPGFTASVQNEQASLGVQWKADIRLNENDRGWTLGDSYTTSIWAGYKVSDWAAVTFGAKILQWGNVEGYDAAYDPSVSLVYSNPAYSRDQGGWRVDLPIGANFIFPGGILKGDRVAFEFLQPVHQELDFYQLRHDWTLAMGWQRSVSFF